ncbi:ABC-F family ATP-binding cassette domain-containing protein [Cryomorphaceae bacterium 1068]|nr:ABC-F family ATP-binding cassette domain-containing protein [Cryomorphaceae bacterium 1068]
MFRLENIRLNFAQRPIFDGIDLFIGENDKIGLVGKNGAGKTTLFKVIIGDQGVDEGHISKPKEYGIGYLPQELAFNSDLSVKEEVSKAFEVTQHLERKIESISKELGEREDYESEEYMDLAEELNRISTQLGIYDVDSQDQQIELVLLGLGFLKEEFKKPLSAFSGGWQMRVALAKILLQKPNLLLLDEPTNHLDIESIQWLEDYLKNYSGAVVLISHDRLFLDNVTNRTAELLNGSIFDYNAAYSRFVELRKDVIEKQIEAKKNQEKEIKQTEDLINKFRAKANKAAFAQSLIKKLDKMERIEVDEEDDSAMDFRFQPAPRAGKVVVKGQGLSKSYGSKQIFKGLDFEILRGQKVALIGKNGVGKTTMTKVIAGETSYEGDCELGYNVDVGYYTQNQSDELPPNLTALEVIENEATGEYRKKVRSLLGAFMFSGDDVFKKVKVLSGGEKARLALCKLMLHQYNFLILDEPTNHLDMRSKEVLKQAIMAYDGTLLVVSHDRDFLQGLANPVIEMHDSAITTFPGTISEFLQRKRAESIKQYEYIKNSPKEKVKKSTGVSEKDKWKLNKRLSALEKEIEKVEDQISKLEMEGVNLDHTDPEKIQAHSSMLETAQKKLEKKMTEWEEVTTKLEG